MSTEKKPSTTERRHHKFSPSKLQSLEGCSGYESSNTTNQAAERGTLLHDILEYLVNNPGIAAAEIAELSDEEAPIMENCRAFVYAQLAELGENARLITEEYLPIDERETTAGYLDIGMISADGRRAKVTDWKMGQNMVEPASNNLQGGAYLLGLLFKFAPNLEEVEVTFVLPFLDGGVMDSHIFYRKDFDALRLRIETVVARAKDAYADFESGKILETWRTKLSPNTSTCLFCSDDRKAVCPALQSFALSAGKKYDPLVVPEVINPLLIKDPEQAGAALKFFAVMEALSKAYRAKATEKAFNDENWVPAGYMVTTMTQRKIVDKQKFYEVIKPLLTEDELMQAIDFTLGPVEKAIKNKAPRGKKTEAVEELGALLQAEGATVESEPIIQLRQRKTKVAAEEPASLT